MCKRSLGSLQGNYFILDFDEFSEKISDKQENIKPARIKFINISVDGKKNTGIFIKPSFASFHCESMILFVRRDENF